MFKSKKVIIGSIIVLAAIVFLSIRAFAGSATYYYELAELMQNRDAVNGDTVKVRGQVQEGSVERVTQETLLRFTIIDETTNENPENRLPVLYKGVVPDTFKEGSEVVIEGSLGADNVFQASVIMPKCPSKYTPVAE